MNLEVQPYIVYVKTDEQNRIIAVNSSEFLADPTDWIAIDSGYSDQYHHAQGNYFDNSLADERGIARYKLVDGKPVERTQTEMDADWVEPAPEPDRTARMEALERAMHAIEEGIASV